MNHTMRTMIAAALFVAGVAVTSAQAGIEGQPIVITVTADGQEIQVELPLIQLPDQAVENGLKKAWGLQNLPGEGLPVQAQPGGPVVARINQLEVGFVDDPVVSISFSATAGSSDTTFTLNSATLSFPALNDPTATADAEFTLTDNDGDGASVALVSGNAGLNRASYNGSNIFAELIGSQNIGAGASTFNESAGPSTITGAVSSMQGQIAFTLSADDSASGSLYYEIVPEPVTFVLLGAGAGLMAVRRRTTV